MPALRGRLALSVKYSAGAAAHVCSAQRFFPGREVFHLICPAVQDVFACPACSILQPGKTLFNPGNGIQAGS